MISNPTDVQKAMIFNALTHAIETNSGIGFRNGDQGHPAYLAGANAEDSQAWGETPEENELFQLLLSFDHKFHENGPDLSTWQKFCGFAVMARDRTRG